jgi:hypothetical protein
MRCKICESSSSLFANAEVLNKYPIRYFRCNACGFIQTEAPYWLDEAYSQKITCSDVGLVSRNIKLARVTRVLISWFFDAEKKFLDYGGGYGLLVRIMRDTGFDFVLWDKFSSTNIFASNFVHELDSVEEYELVTAYEVFEHFVDPLIEIEGITTFSKNILFSTTLVPHPTPRPVDWWYYGLEHGQHVSFFTYESLEILADRMNLNLFTDKRSLHLLTEKDLSSVSFRFSAWNKAAEVIDLFIRRESLLAQDYHQVTGKELH